MIPAAVANEVQQQPGAPAANPPNNGQQGNDNDNVVMNAQGLSPEKISKCCSKKCYTNATLSLIQAVRCWMTTRAGEQLTVSYTTGEKYRCNKFPFFLNICPHTAYYRERDVIDYIYLGFRLAMLLFIMFFYASAGRIGLLLVGIAVIQA